MTWASLQSSPSLASIEAFLSHKSTVSLHSQWLLALPWLRGFRGFWLSDGRVTQNLFPYLKFRLCLEDTQHLPPHSSVPAAASSSPVSFFTVMSLCPCVGLTVTCLKAGAQHLLAKGALWPTSVRDGPGHPPLPPLLPGIWTPSPPPLGSGFLWGYLFV